MRFAYLIEPPFNYTTQNKDVTGCDVEVARYLNKELGLGPFEPIEVEFSELLPGVKSGAWEMTTGMFVTKERENLARFSRPIWALPDGLLVAKDNPKELTGYRSMTNIAYKLGVIRDQIQHHTALDFGVQSGSIEIYDTYKMAAMAVLNGEVDAYASVARAHAGFIQQNTNLDLSLVPIPYTEKEPATGSFAFAINNEGLRKSVDDLLFEFLGSKTHREIMLEFGFSDEEVDLVANYGS